MKPTKLVFTLGLAVVTSLFLSACGPGSHVGHHHDHDHDHDHHGHAHHHDHGEHDHGAPAGVGDALQAAAGQVAGAAALVINEEPTAAQLAAAKPYPLDTCLVAGEELGSMGEPLVVLVGNQQVKLCCAHCLPELKENTAELLAKLNR